jgi:glycosyltransferase involved in cell wall biosynthesis
VDDASPDDGKTAHALRALQRQHEAIVPIVVVEADTNGGPGAARNRAWEVASQPYLAFLDADDAWHPRKIEIQYGFMQATPEAALCGHRTRVRQPDTDWPPIAAAMAPRRLAPNVLLLSNRLPTRTVMLKRDVPFRFEEAKRYSEDYLLWLRLVLHGAPAWTLDLPLACSFKHDVGAGGLSAAIWRMERGELDTYAQLRQERLISGWLYCTAVCVSLAKFVVRTSRVALARLVVRPR